MTGEKPREPWYSVPSIDLYAKEISDLTQSYLDQCKPMDKQYIDAVKAKYESLPKHVLDADRKQLKSQQN